jgi:DeoR family transcriptional regulator, fructose operon transcriptional repressor
MLAEERQEIIIDLVNKKGTVMVTDLGRELNVSLPTIRRDLEELAKKGQIKKIHGGAMTLTKELSFGERKVQNIKEKIRIAEIASRFVNDSDVIFLDAGTTVFQMVNFLRKRNNLVILTNSIETSLSLIGLPNIVCNLIGGSIKPVSYATVGVEAIQNIKRYKVNKLFMGADGVADHTFTVQDINEALTKRAMMEIACERYLLIDSSKIGKPTFVEVGKLDELTKIITEKPQSDL